jgi:hypothetical protein
MTKETIKFRLINKDVVNLREFGYSERRAD